MEGEGGGCLALGAGADVFGAEAPARDLGGPPAQAVVALAVDEDVEGAELVDLQVDGGAADAGQDLGEVAGAPAAALVAAAEVAAGLALRGVSAELDELAGGEGGHGDDLAGADEVAGLPEDRVAGGGQLDDVGGRRGLAVQLRRLPGGEDGVVLAVEEAAEDRDGAGEQVGLAALELDLGAVVELHAYAVGVLRGDGDGDEAVDGDRVRVEVEAEDRRRVDGGARGGGGGVGGVRFARARRVVAGDGLHAGVVAGGGGDRRVAGAGGLGARAAVVHRAVLQRRWQARGEREAEQKGEREVCAHAVTTLSTKSRRECKGLRGGRRWGSGGWRQDVGQAAGDRVGADDGRVFGVGEELAQEIVAPFVLGLVVDGVELATDRGAGIS